MVRDDVRSALPLVPGCVAFWATGPYDLCASGTTSNFLSSEEICDQPRSPTILDTLGAVTLIANLIIGNKLYSSWSLRAWLVMKAFDLPFDETVIPLYQPNSVPEVLRYSPSGKVPVLIDGDVIVWESMAIIEYLAEKYPHKGIWPREARSRAHARAACAEMHAGFGALRGSCAMNLGKRFASRDRGEAVAQDVARLTALFREARSRFGSSGDFLYNDFSAADAMYAPVVTRLETYSIKVDDVSRTYMDAVLSHPAFLAWRTAALTESWVIAEAEADEEAIEVFRELRD